ncbi:glycoside hydrolase family 3 C-terminal domain-containing protein [Streptomyces sp. NPDC002746]
MSTTPESTTEDTGAGRPLRLARVAALTLAEKASLTSGSGFWHTEPLPAAGLPAVQVADGPHGLRKQDGNGGSADALGLGTSVPATCFPPAVALASSWDAELVARVGAALGEEARAEGVAVLLGPGVNIKRSPLCGRNFEYFSEDPFLTGRLGAAYVGGVQAQGVGTSLKHFAANNQETDRLRVSAEVDARTLREIYLPAFEHIVTTAQPYTVMAAYNKINGVYATEHRWLLTEVLRGEWGFEGLVVSDWGAVADRVAALAGGTDVEMPPTGTDGELVAAVERGALDEALLEAAAERLLHLAERTAAVRTGAFSYDRAAHHELAREAAEAGAVLLRNERGLLPLDAAGSGRIAVLGEFARTPRYQGAGSSQVVPTRLDDALGAITALAGADRVDFAPGFTLDGVADPALVADAVALAERAETVVLFLGLPAACESEGFDRTDIELPADQVALLERVHAVNPRTVVVLSNGAAVSVAPWQRHAPALLEGWLLGQAGGSATARLLFGQAEPGGRLTETLPLKLSDAPSHLFFPGGESLVRYGEGVYVGYRGYDTLDTPVAYPFGHGLGYTSFELSGLTAVRTGPNAFSVACEVTNTGERAGAAVVQLYVRDLESSVDRPLHELKGFAKVRLEPGARSTVRLELDERAFAYWSQAANRWKVEPGSFELRVGFSSRDLPLTAVVEAAGDGIVPVLDASSTMDEWLAHPVGGPLLHDAAGEGLDGRLAALSPGMRRALGAMPLRALASFGLNRLVGEPGELLAAYAVAPAPHDVPR